MTKVKACHQVKSPTRLMCSQRPVGHPLCLRLTSPRWASFLSPPHLPQLGILPVSNSSRLVRHPSCLQLISPSWASSCIHPILPSRASLVAAPLSVLLVRGVVTHATPQVVIWACLSVLSALVFGWDASHVSGCIRLNAHLVSKR